MVLWQDYDAEGHDVITISGILMVACLAFQRYLALIVQQVQMTLNEFTEFIIIKCTISEVN
jgi:hypothetical protein